MKERVDTGDIIMTSYFAVSPHETVESLKLKSMNHLLFIFEKIIHGIYTADSLPKSDEKWLRLPYTKKMLDELCKIDPDTMDADEIGLRIRATDYGSSYNGAYIDICGNRFFARSSVGEPVV
jgi:methionyl-tRNA formyltransferase